MQRAWKRDCKSNWQQSDIWVRGFMVWESNSADSEEEEAEP